MARRGVPGDRQQAQQGRERKDVSSGRVGTQRCTPHPDFAPRGDIISSTGGSAGHTVCHTVCHEGGTHPGQGLLDVFSGSRDVTEDHAGAVLLQMVQKEQCFHLKKKKLKRQPPVERAGKPCTKQKLTGLRTEEDGVLWP